MTKQRKTNTFENLFGDLLKTLQLLDGKELTPFQSGLYENTLHSAIQSIKKGKHPFPAYARYETLNTTPKESDEEYQKYKKKTEKEFYQVAGVKPEHPAEDYNENPGFAATEVEPDEPLNENLGGPETNTI